MWGQRKTQLTQIMNIQIDAKCPSHPKADSQGWLTNIVNPSGTEVDVLERARLFTGVSEWRVRSNEDDSLLTEFASRITAEHNAVLALRADIQGRSTGDPMKDVLHTCLLMLINGTTKLSFA